MDVKELTTTLGNYITSNRYKFVPWWEGDHENSMYRYSIFNQEEIEAIEACVAACGKDALAATAGSSGMPLFHLLVWHNLYGAVEHILNDEALSIDVDMCDLKNKGLTPLLIACSRGNFAMAKLLIEHGADMTHCDALGRNAYHYLASPRIEGLQNGHEGKRYALGQREQIARLLSDGINTKDTSGQTPFSLMLQQDDANLSFALTDVFLEKGSDTDIVDEDGNTLLLMALHKRHFTAALALAKQCSGMVNTANAKGETPMQAAKKTYNEAIRMALKDYGSTEDSEVARMDIANLSRITSNAFASFSDDERDKLSIALYLTKKLIAEIDMDDDDELGYLTEILHNSLINDEKCHVMDFCKEAGIDFTAPIHHHGSLFCLRDKCLAPNFGVKTIKKLIEYGVDIDEAIVQGKTPVSILASTRPRNMMFSNKKDDFFENAAPFFSKESMEQLDNSGISAVHWAARNGHCEMLKVMLEKGVDPNITEDKPAEAGNTPLHEAATWGHPDIIKLLEASGADSSIHNVSGELPAHYAVMKKSFGGDLEEKQRVAMLKELTHLDGPRSDGKTPLMLLMLLGINAVQTLLPIFLEKGVNINATDNVGNTALIFHTKNQCYKEIVKELVRAGADINMADNEGNTALHYVLKYNGPEVARFLIKKGADYNRANNKGETPVQIAVEKGFDTVLELMTDIQ